MKQNLVLFQGFDCNDRHSNYLLLLDIKTKLIHVCCKPVIVWYYYYVLQCACEQLLASTRLSSSA